MDRHRQDRAAPAAAPPARRPLRPLRVALLLACLLAPAAAFAQSAFQSLLDRAGIPLTVPPEGRFILVNVPGFEVIAFRDGEPVLRSRAIVGTPWSRTPLRDTHVSAVRFRPTWRPTPSMVARGEYRDRVWPAGPDNPLGLAAVRLEPGMLVYLHGTNHPELFERTERALSHGCVRVERWDDLVAFVLDLDLAAVHAYAYGTRTFDMPADPIPVTLGYFLVFPDETGALVEHPDIYRRGASVPAAPRPAAPAAEGCAAEP